MIGPISKSDFEGNVHIQNHSSTPGRECTRNESYYLNEKTGVLTVLDAMAEGRQTHWGQRGAALPRERLHWPYGGGSLTQPRIGHTKR